VAFFLADKLLGAGVADTDLAELVLMVCAITDFSQEYSGNNLSSWFDGVFFSHDLSGCMSVCDARN